MQGKLSSLKARVLTGRKPDKQAWWQGTWVTAGWFVLATAVILAMVLVLRHTTFFTNLDNVDQYYSWYQKFARSFHRGYLPIWNTGEYGGFPFAGEIQPGIFYPLNWLFVGLFGSVNGISDYALNCLMALHFALGAFGAFLAVRELKASWKAAFVSGLTYAFSGAVAFRAISQSSIFFGLCLLPYPLYFLLKYHHDAARRWRWLLACGLALAMVLLSGHIQPTYHAILIMLIYEVAALKRDWKATKGAPAERLRAAWRKVWHWGWPLARQFSVIFGVFVIVALPQLLVSARYLPHSYRIQASGYAAPGEKITYAEFTKPFNLNIHEFSNLVDPDSYPIRDGNNIFLGLLPLAVIILALVFGRQQIKRSRLWQEHSDFLLGLLLISIFAMIGYWTWFAVVMYELPFLYQIRQLGRYAVVFQFAMVMLLAVSFDSLEKVKLKARAQRNLLLLGSFLLINAVYLMALRHHIFGEHFALQMGVLALGILAFAWPRGSMRARLIVVMALLIITPAVNTRWYLPKLTAETKTARNYKIQPDLAQFLNGTNGMARITIADDALPVNIGNAYDVQSVSGYGATIYQPFYEINNKSGVDKDLVSDLLGVTYVFSRVKQPENNLVYTDDAQHVYGHARISALLKMFTTDREGSTNRADYANADVVTEHYDDRYQRYTVTVPKEQKVIISELTGGGWHLYIDGKPSSWQPYKLGGVDFLREFTVPAGHHLIEFKYRPLGIY